MASTKKSKSKKASTVIVAGHWDLAWNTPIKEIDLWRYPLQDFGVDKFYMTPVTGIDNKRVEERASLEEILEENKDCKVVFCDERAKTELKDFKHPKKALYVFGRANFSPFLSLKRKHDLELRVETPHEKGGLLWGHQTAGIILYDRYIKGGKIWQ